MDPTPSLYCPHMWHLRPSTMPPKKKMAASSDSVSSVGSVGSVNRGPLEAAVAAEAGAGAGSQLRLTLRQQRTVDMALSVVTELAGVAFAFAFGLVRDIFLYEF